MKTFKLIFFLGSVFAISAAFFACSTKPDPAPTSVTPSIVFIAPNKPSQEYDKFDLIQFHFTAARNTNTNQDLTKIKMKAHYSTGEADSTLMDYTVLPSETVTKVVQYSYTVSGTAPYGQIITITVTAEDKDAKVFTGVYTFTITNLTNLNIYDVTMGAQDNITLGSYFATDSGLVWKVTEAKQKQSRVDFIYFFDDQNNNANCIAAPFSTEVNDWTNLVANWNTITRNKTILKLIAIADPADYDKIKTYEAIKLLFDNALMPPNLYFVPTLTDGGALSTSYIVFKTIKNKYGIIKVVLINPGSPQTKNSVAINVKVQK